MNLNEVIHFAYCKYVIGPFWVVCVAGQGRSWCLWPQPIERWWSVQLQRHRRTGSFVSLFPFAVIYAHFFHKEFHSSRIAIRTRKPDIVMQGDSEFRCCKPARVTDFHWLTVSAAEWKKRAAIKLMTYLKRVQDMIGYIYIYKIKMPLSKDEYNWIIAYDVQRKW